MSQNGANDRHNYNSKCETDEFMVAADFTLYSNPINKMLYRPASEAAHNHAARDSNSSKAEESTKTPNSTSSSSASGREDQLTSSSATARDTAANERQSKESSEEDEWIASDMTKYESPLADLERQGFDRDHREAQKQNPNP